MKKLKKKPDDNPEMSPDKASEKPEVFIVRRGSASLSSRREFISASLSAGAAISFGTGILAGCKKEDEKPGSVFKSVYQIILKHDGSVSSVSFSPDGKKLASGGHDRKVKIWSIPDGQLLHTMEGHTNEVETVGFSPDGKILASGSRDGVSSYGNIKIWSVPDGQLLHTIEGLLCVKSVCFSPDGQTLAAGNLDGTIKLWATEDWNSDSDNKNLLWGGIRFALAPGVQPWPLAAGIIL